MKRMGINVKIASRAFRRGFAQGLGAPVLFFVPVNYSRDVSQRATIDSAWESVEKALNDSFKKEIGRGKATNRKAGRSKEAA